MPGYTTTTIRRVRMGPSCAGSPMAAMKNFPQFLPSGAEVRAENHPAVVHFQDRGKEVVQLNGESCGTSEVAGR
jgi:hypothetical protein